MNDGSVAEARPYQVYVFDCPYCGGQALLGDADPATFEECTDCGAEVEMTS
jgi:hypothetical protein